MPHGRRRKEAPCSGDEFVDAHESMAQEEPAAVGPEEVPFSPVKTRRQRMSEESAKENAGPPPNVQPGQKQQQQQQKPKGGAEGGARASERVRDARDNGHALRAAYAAYEKASKEPFEKPEEGNFEQKVERNTDLMARTAKLFNSFLALFVEDHTTTVETVKMLREVADDYIAKIGPEEERRKRQQDLENRCRSLEQRVEKLETEKVSKAEVEAEQERMKKELAAVDLKIRKSYADATRWRATSQPNSAPIGYSQTPTATPIVDTVGPAGVFPTTVFELKVELEAQEKAACDARITNLPGSSKEIKDVVEELRKTAGSMDASTERSRAASEAADLLMGASIVTQFTGNRPGTTTYTVRFRSTTEQRSFTAERVRRAFASKGVGITWMRTAMQMRRGRAIAALEKEAKSKGLATAWVQGAKGKRLYIQNVEVTKEQIAAKHRELHSETTERVNQAGLGGSTQPSA